VFGILAGAVLITVSVGFATGSFLAALVAGFCYGVLLMLVGPFVPVFFGERPVSPATVGLRPFRSDPLRKKIRRASWLVAITCALAGVVARVVFDSRWALDIGLCCTVLAITGTRIWYVVYRRRHIED
jgi:hypothetical protein